MLLLLPRASLVGIIFLMQPFGFVVGTSLLTHASE